MKTYSRSNKVQFDTTKLPQEYLNSCRLCLANVSHNSFFNIFAFNKNIAKNKIKFCTSLEISESDGLPSKICESCNIAINNFYSFKKMCISNELKLQKYSKIPKTALSELSLQNDVELNRSENVLSEKDVISLVEPKCNTGSLLLEEENIHPDAPDEVIFQIKKDSIDPYTINQNVTDVGDQKILDPLVPKTLKEEHHLSERSRETLSRSYCCRECKKLFSRTDSLINHEKLVHNINRLYCSHCSKSFVSKSLIERHMRTHTNDKPFQCGICSKTFSQKESMNRHFTRLHCEKKYECDKCPKVFTTREGLKSHIFTHHTVRTNEDLSRYKCKYCIKSFCHSSGLSRHLHTHSGVLFSCKVCHKGFSDASCLRRHSLTTHQEINHPYKVGIFQPQNQNMNNLIIVANTNRSVVRNDQAVLPYG